MLYNTAQVTGLQPFGTSPQQKTRIWSNLLHLHTQIQEAESYGTGFSHIQVWQQSGTKDPGHLVPKSYFIILCKPYFKKNIGQWGIQGENILLLGSLLVRSQNIL